jgi:twitching motility protein PilT
MLGIDSLLDLITKQGADELRVGVDVAPRMFAGSAQKKLSIPATSAETLRALLGELLSAERERALVEAGVVELSHVARDGAPFAVTLTRRGPAPSAGEPLLFDATFQKGARRPGAASAQGAGATSASRAPQPGLAPTMAPPPSAAAASQASSLSPPSPQLQYPSPLSRSVLPPDLPQRSGASAPTTPSSGAPPKPDATTRQLGGAAQAGAGQAGLGGASNLGLGGASFGAPLGTPSLELVELVARAVRERASDLHLADLEGPSLRVDGALRPLPWPRPIDVAALLTGLVGPAHEARLAEGRGVDLALGLALPGRADEPVRLRLAAFRASDKLALAVRILPARARSLDELGLPVDLGALAELPHGLVLVTGPTGSGKSTTLAALAQEVLRRRAVVLVTLEDPVEIPLAAVLPGSVVRQRSIGRDAPTFSAGLRDALRADPDVLLVGELRDAETIELALTAAETGHLVLATLHSRSAASTVERILDAVAPERQGQVRSQLADSLRAVVSQRLLPRAKGSGRAVALEVLRGTHASAAMVREGRTAQLASVVQAGKREGMIQLDRCLAELVTAGAVRREDALAQALDRTTFEHYLSG